MVAVVLGAFSYTGGKLEGYRRDPTVDEVARKEFLRKNRRRPIEGTLEELGEGRGEYNVLRRLQKARGKSVWIRTNIFHRHLRPWLR